MCNESKVIQGRLEVAKRTNIVSPTWKIGWAANLGSGSGYRTLRGHGTEEKKAFAITLQWIVGCKEFQDGDAACGWAVVQRGTLSTVRCWQS